MMIRRALCGINLILVYAGLVAGQERPRDVISINQEPNKFLEYDNGIKISTQQLSNLDIVFEFLLNNTPPNGFATCLGYGDSLSSIFAHTACYNLSDQSTCTDCLRSYRQGRERLMSTFRMWITSQNISTCNIRYETMENFTRFLPPDTLGILGPNATVPHPRPTVPTPAPADTARTKSNNTPAIAGAVVGSIAVIALLVAGFLVLKRRKHRQFRHPRSQGPGSNDFKPGTTGVPIVFSYQDLSTATEDFSHKNTLGQGGFGSVFKAQLVDGTELAVKQLSLGSQQGRREFVNEINIITSLQHRNLVKLVGYCAEKGLPLLLVYEFPENRSLDRALFGSQWTLDWPCRVQIVVGIAKGLAYLHEESHVQIIHRDIKASNILLDKKLQPKISDFGISRLEDAVSGGVATTRVAGTPGYMPPEYLSRGRVTSKADVFSFGILVLEIVSGRKCMDSTLPPDEEILLQKVWALHRAENLDELFDPRLEKSYVAEEAQRLVHVAMLCAHDSADSRPKMSEVVAMLMGFLSIPPLSQVQAPLTMFGQIKRVKRGNWSSSSSSSTGQTSTASSDQSYFHTHLAPR